MRTEIIYSGQKTDYLPGYRYANPRLFNRPRQGVTSVIIVGSWPAVEAAYRNAQAVTVAVVGDERELIAFLDRRASVHASIAPHIESGGSTDDPRELRRLVELPEDVDSLPWPQLLSIASKLSDKPIKSRNDANEAIEAERELRRKEAE